MADPATPGANADQPETPVERLRALAELTRLAGKRGGTRKLTDRQLERFAGLYRSAANHLALVREFGASTRQLEELNQLVGRAHGILYGRPVRPPLGTLLRHQLLALPDTVRTCGRYAWCALALLLVGGIYGYLGAEADPEWSAAHLMPGDQRTPFASKEELLNSLFTGREGEVGTLEKSLFATQLFWNNFKVSLLVMFFGVLVGIPTVVLLIQNGILLGNYTWIHHNAGLGYEWWAWILPHGVTEIGGICVLGGGGLWIGHTILAPGSVSRRTALAAIRPHLIRLVGVGLVAMVLAALLESFQRQSEMSTPWRYAVAVLTFSGWALLLKFSPKPTPPSEEELGVTAARRHAPLPELEDMLGTQSASGAAAR